MGSTTAGNRETEAGRLGMTVFERRSTGSSALVYNTVLKCFSLTVSQQVL